MCLLTVNIKEGWEDAFHKAASQTNPSKPGYSPARSAVAQLLNPVQGQERAPSVPDSTHSFGGLCPIRPDGV